jgi:hypothetical protein
MQTTPSPPSENARVDRQNEANIAREMNFETARRFTAALKSVMHLRGGA